MQTRLRKLSEGTVQATLLALAGLKRLDMTQHVTAILETDEMLPAIAQGAIGIACRSNDSTMVSMSQTRNFLQQAHDYSSWFTYCENFLGSLQGLCSNCMHPFLLECLTVERH